MAFDWFKIKTEYLTDRTATLRSVADKHGVALAHIGRVAAAGKWREKKVEMQLKVQQKVIEKLPETIAQIKARHIGTARLVQTEMIKLIESGNIKSNSTIADLKSAIDIERDALGLNDKKQTDEIYEKFSQFNFIFSLKPDELRRFVKSALTRSSNASGGPSPVLPSGNGEGRDQ